MSQSPLYGYAGAAKLPRRAGVMVLGLILMVGAWLAAVTYFGEWGATWGPISVWIWGLALILVVCFGLALFGFLQYPAANWMLWLILIFFGLSIALGTYGTEAATNGGIPRSVLAQEHTAAQRSDDNYRYSRGGGFYYYYWYPYWYGDHTSTTSDTSSSSPSCTGKSCGGLVLVVVVVVLLLLSAFVPHFWVIAALCAIVMLSLCLYRELEARDYARALGSGADIARIWGEDE